MSKRWRFANHGEHLRWLAHIQAVGVNLTTWEESFIERIDQKMEQGLSLSGREAEILEQIYAERTP